MQLRYSVVLSSMLLVAGCTDSTITLQKEKTGETATCGGQIMIPGRPSNTDRCVKMMEEAGYKQVGEKP